MPADTYTTVTNGKCEGTKTNAMKQLTCCIMPLISVTIHAHPELVIPRWLACFRTSLAKTPKQFNRTTRTPVKYTIMVMVMVINHHHHHHHHHHHFKNKHRLYLKSCTMLLNKPVSFITCSCCVASINATSLNAIKCWTPTILHPLCAESD